MKKILIGSLGLLLLSGCSYKYKYSKVPYPIKHMATEKYELQSAYHWKLIAENYAKALDKLDGKIYLEPLTNNDSVFSENFLNLLKSELIKRNRLVLKDTPNATKIKLKINVVKFNSNRDEKKFPYKLTLLAAGLWVLAPITTPIADAVLATNGVIVGESVYNSKYNKFYSNVPKHEIIINAYAYKNNTYLKAVDKIYYVADEDSDLYENGDCATIYVKGDNE